MPVSPTAQRELQILEHIETNPDATQADLAEELGVAIGTVNFAIRRLIKRGYIHAKQLQRRRLQYIITPSGIALRSKLAVDSLQYSMRLYRETRQQAKRLLTEAWQQGYRQVAIQGDGDIAEIVRLTCLEMGIEVKGDEGAWPTIRAVGTALVLAGLLEPDIDQPASARASREKLHAR
jgi:DNA-binding MarR family transcriptional regulator